MTTSWRWIAVILVGAIVAAATFAVYMLSGLNDEEVPDKLGSIDNFIAAREIKPAPLLTFLDEEGTKVTLEKFRGKIVVLNLWATWCTPCVAEMPMLDRLQQQLEGVGVVVVALSIDRGGPDVVREFFDEHEITHLGVYVDPTMRAQSDVSAIGLPTTIIIDREGNDRGRIVGPAEWDDAEAADLVLKASAPLK
ncbi:MAG: TlpA disulfide reductase family protein [Alphaproteobacteria bacterium]|jgi:thiol-disulfide isomerase/thioredoxin|nr:TlpA disulfide reductase family protein [Hyphomicrobium aestuarii]MDZ4868273.1 TlpA disulfide reductase family protein [Alphaproteobacteria bacterium]